MQVMDQFSFRLSRGLRVRGGPSRVGSRTARCESPRSSRGSGISGSPALHSPPVEVNVPLSLFRRALLEALGTFALVALGCGAVVVDQQTGVVGHLGICAIFGAAVTLVIIVIGPLSGAHINPAVTVAFAALDVFPWREVGAYAAAQLLGATAAAALLWGLLEGFAASTLGATLYPELGPGGAVLVEVLLTAQLMAVIAAVVLSKDLPPALGPAVIGLSVAVAAGVGGPLTGASMNPARSLGPAVVAAISGAGEVSLPGQWLYVAAPVVGALLGGLGYRWLATTPER